jgi:cephalosporin hydroxylase
MAIDFSMYPKAEKDKIRAVLDKHPTVVEDFHTLMFYSHVQFLATWLGVPLCKTPNDLWLYQEIIWRVKPDLIVETGTAYGGCSLYLASLLDRIGNGLVVTIDLAIAQDRPQHERIDYLKGSSTSPAIADIVRDYAREASRTMVILDSCHATEHVAREIEIYAPLVSVDSFLIVEDSNVDGNPVSPDYVDFYSLQRGGPMKAIEAFLATSDDFVVDPIGDRYFVSFNPKGWLRRVKKSS